MGVGGLIRKQPLNSIPHTECVSVDENNEQNQMYKWERVAKNPIWGRYFILNNDSYLVYGVDSGGGEVGGGSVTLMLGGETHDKFLNKMYNLLSRIRKHFVNSFKRKKS